MVDAGTQTENQWFSSDEEVQTEQEEAESVTVIIGKQIEEDVLLLVHEIVKAWNKETTKLCEEIVDEKYISLVVKYEGLFNDTIVTAAIISVLRESDWLRGQSQWCNTSRGITTM